MDIETRSKTLSESKQPTALHPQPANNYKLTVKKQPQPQLVGWNKKHK